MDDQDVDYIDDADDDDDEEPANVDEDAGVGEDDGEEAEGIAACRDHHQCLSPTNPDKDENKARRTILKMAMMIMMNVIDGWQGASLLHRYIPPTNPNEEMRIFIKVGGCVAFVETTINEDIIMPRE